MSKLTDQFDEVAAISRQAFAAGDVVTGIAAIKLAAQLVQIMRLLGPPAPTHVEEQERSMKPDKPLGAKAYGSIGHLPQSRVGPEAPAGRSGHGTKRNEES